MPSLPRLRDFGIFREGKFRLVSQVPGSFSLAGHKWARYSALKQAARALRKAGQAKRRQWLDEQLAEAELACTKGDQGAIYRVVHSLAPKRRRDQVRIRSTQGHQYTVRQEFEEIFEYFSKALMNFSLPLTLTRLFSVLLRS